MRGRRQQLVIPSLSFIFMQHPKEEKTFVMIKPDGVKKGLVGEIIKRFEQRDLKIVALEMFQATTADIDEHYPKDDAWIERLGAKTLATYEKYGYNPSDTFTDVNPLIIGGEVRNWLINYMVSAPMVKMIVQGTHAIDMVRKVVGSTIPANADMGTIRGDFSVDSPVLANKEKRSVMNLIHASETAGEAEHEIKLWFGDKAHLSYERYTE
jgi:nucleoside-diphosphate kinase